ncbi:MAG TPA: transglutaminase-like domain-containing protein [Arachnia sp.]|nr:transglutaminase-like domain-containing protein [Arachnia sp.]HMT85907.1 transglutaminase-like domain-containing protein [Arachnia sp.]
MKRSLLPPFSWPRVIGAWLLLLPGVVAFQPTFGGWSGYLASFVGVTLGAGIALLAVGLGWSVMLWLLALVGVYFLVGGPLALPDSTVFGVLPSLETLRELTLLIVFGWKDLLTVSTPVGDIPGPPAVPLLAGLIVGTVTVGLARATRAVFLPLLVPLAWLAFSIAFGVRTAPTAPWLGAALGAGLLVWMTGHRLAAHRSASTRFLVRKETGISRGTMRVIVAAVVIALAAGGAVAANQVAEGRVYRQVLRDLVEPPLDLHDFPSPLMKFRLYELTEKTNVLFRVEVQEGKKMPEGARLRLAVMDSYDGVVFSVSEKAGTFVRSGRELPIPDSEKREIKCEMQAVRPKETLTLRVTPDKYDDVWLPSPGLSTTMAFQGDPAVAKEQAKRLHFNKKTFQALTAARFGKGSVLEVTAAPIISHTDAERYGFATAGTGCGPRAQVTERPDVLGELATTLTAEATSTYEKLTKIQDYLHEKGAYSDGKDGRSRSGHTKERLKYMFDQPNLVGDDEQYAVAMALMADSLGIPVRVVLGFYPLEKEMAKPDGGWGELTGEEARVWVEASLDGVGWVSFDPSPDRDKELETEVPEPKPQPKPQVDPPPNPPERLPEEPIVPDEPPDQEEEEEEADSNLMRYLLIAAAAAGGAGILALPFLVILGMKARRATRRRTRGTPSDQVAGAWDEIVDRARDMGYQAPSTTTRRESAAGLQEAYPQVGVAPLAGHIDALVFGPVPPGEHQRDAAWETVPAVKKALLVQVPWYRRVPARLSLRSLRGRRTEAALAARTRKQKNRRQGDRRSRKGESATTGHNTKEQS